MRAIATKQPNHDSAKEGKNRDRVRSRHVSPLSTGMSLLQRQCACGGGCPRCQEKLGIQTKLRISEPGDKYEQEADRIADEVMRMPEPSVQRQVEPEEEEEEEEMVQREAIADPITPLIQRQVMPEIEEEEVIQTKAIADRVSSSAPTQAFSEAPSIVREVLNSPGQPLNRDTRAFMESRFGHDFSQVQVYTDSKAVESAQAVNALAYTVGQNIVFGAGQYSLTTTEGKHLLAHELTHVVQQSGNAPNYHTNSATIQRQADIDRAPRGLRRLCTLRANAAPFPGGIDCLFTVNSNTLEPLSIAAITNFVRNWHIRGSVDEIRVQGFASVDGRQRTNWQLSCDRAVAVRDELIRQGVASGRISIFAHGESDIAPTVEGNRRAVISTVAATAPRVTPLPIAPPLESTDTCPQSFSVTVSRGNDDPGECQYETARITVTLTLDPCACNGGTPIPVTINYLAVLEGKSFMDDPPTTLETTSSTLGRNFVLLEEGTSNQSAQMVHTLLGLPGDPDDTLEAQLLLFAALPCDGSSAVGRVFVQPRGSGNPLQFIQWSASADSSGVQQANVSITERAARFPTLPPLPLRSGTNPYPTFPGTPRDRRCTCNRITGEHEGTNCPPQFLRGGAVFGSGSGS